jgi:hypothetical protein
MSEPIRDADAVSKHRLEEATPVADDADQTPAAPARPCHVPVLPGYGQHAYRTGCEDEWIDRMAARYGGDW